jgi:TetR/AcrR family transcriptional regulator
MNPRPKSLGTRNQPEQTKAAILKAALVEFANMGLAGARTDAIANAAGVNKALLYYYFRDKETLYGATLESVFAPLSEKLQAVLGGPGDPPERVIGFAATYFDTIAANPLYPRLVQHEMMRAGSGLSPHIQRIVEKYQRPTYSKLVRVFDEGIRTGLFRKVDVLQFLPSMVAIIVFYFSSTPMLRAIMPGDPLSPERVAARREAVLDFISAALFEPEKRGSRLVVRDARSEPRTTNHASKKEGRR